MLSETAARRRVELYRASRFPDEWTLERVLLRNVRATDATLLRHEGRWWLFVALAVEGGHAVDELALFSSGSLDGEWKPHPLNPVVSDVRSARPAGRIFSRNGQLIRPAQDCSRVYRWTARVQPHRGAQRHRLPRGAHRRDRAGARDRQSQDSFLRLRRHLRGSGWLSHPLEALAGGHLAGGANSTLAPSRSRGVTARYSIVTGDPVADRLEMLELATRNRPDPGRGSRQSTRSTTRTTRSDRRGFSWPATTRPEVWWG